MCSNSMVSAHLIFKVNQTKIKGGCQLVRKVISHDSKSDLPLEKGKGALTVDHTHSVFSLRKDYL